MLRARRRSVRSSSLPSTSVWGQRALVQAYVALSQSTCIAAAFPNDCGPGKARMVVPFRASKTNDLHVPYIDYTRYPALAHNAPNHTSPVLPSTSGSFVYLYLRHLLTSCRITR